MASGALIFHEFNRAYFHSLLRIKEVKYSILPKNQLACTSDPRNRPLGNCPAPTIYLNSVTLHGTNLHTFMRVILHEMIHVYQFNHGLISQETAALNAHDALFTKIVKELSHLSGFLIEVTTWQSQCPRNEYKHKKNKPREATKTT